MHCLALLSLGWRFSVQQPASCCNTRYFADCGSTLRMVTRYRRGSRVLIPTLHDDFLLTPKSRIAFDLLANINPVPSAGRV